MKWNVSGLGAEPKKVVLLGVLVLAAAYLLYNNFSGHPGETSDGVAGRRAAPAAGPAAPRAATNRAGRNRANLGARGNLQEFRPSLKPKKDEVVDPSRIDPTLRLDLLAKLKSVRVEGGTRNLFESGAGPAQAKIKEPAKIIPKPIIYGPPRPPTAAEIAASKPPPPPIPLKFYGFISPMKSGVKRAFFLDGDDIIVAGEGELVKNRYKVVRIGINSAVVEDTQANNNQQTLPLVQEMAG